MAIALGAFALLGSYGCERPNPYKVGGEGVEGTNCPPIDPSTTSASASSTSASSTVSATTGQASSSATGEQATTGGAGAGGPGVQTELDERVLDYSEALRTASLKLVGDLPSLEQIYQLGDAKDADKPTVYASLIDDMMNDTRFAEQLIRYHRQTFKMGDVGNPGITPVRDSAAVFAARLVFEGKDWRDLVQASANTCPTWDEENKMFVDGECNNGITPVGILTDPGIHAVYYGNLALRRNRFYHETLLCRSANASGGAEPSNMPSQVGPPVAPDKDCSTDEDCLLDVGNNNEANIGLSCINQKCTNLHCGTQAPKNYAQPWDMTELAGACNGGRINFHEWNTTVVCANCHSTWNHRSPLWANFDDQGQYQSTIQVHTPVDGDPVSLLTDWLPQSELDKDKPYAWKYSTDGSGRVKDLEGLAQKIVEDDEVIACAVKRTYNWAMSRGDIIDRSATVPSTVIGDHVSTFKANNYNMKQALRAIFLHDDFVRF